MVSEVGISWRVIQKSSTTNIKKPFQPSRYASKMGEHG
jgi:hypothetical protein